MNYILLIQYVNRADNRLLPVNPFISMDVIVSAGLVFSIPKQYCPNFTDSDAKMVLCYKISRFFLIF